MKITPKKLVDAGICISFAEARRLIASSSNVMTKFHEELKMENMMMFLNVGGYVLRHKMSNTKISIRSYLDKVRPREKVPELVKRLKIIMDMARINNLPDNINDPENEHKAYELLGMAVMRSELIYEFNRELMEWACNYTCIVPWAKELWELKEHMKNQADLARELIRAIVLQKYQKEKEKAEKPA